MERNGTQLSRHEINRTDLPVVGVLSAPRTSVVRLKVMLLEICL